MTVTATDPESTTALPSERIQKGHSFRQSQIARAIDRAEDFYTFDQPQVTRRFLRNHPGLLEVLFDALPHVERYFDYSDLVVSLTEPTEPGEGDERGLYIRVVTSADVDKADRQLDAFDEGWWLEQPFEIRTRLCFDIDFK